MGCHLKNFVRDESGAVTVDWVVLTAGVIGLCLTALGIMELAALGVVDDMDTAMERREEALATGD